MADSCLDDEQMMSVDDALSEVFRKRLEGMACCRKKQQKGESPVSERLFTVKCSVRVFDDGALVCVCVCS